MLSCTFCSGEAFSSAQNSEKSLGGPGSASNPAGGAYSTPPDSLAGGEGLNAPPPEPNPASASGLDFGPSGLWLGPFGPCTAAILCS